jgi:hypothetical protein
MTRAVLTERLQAHDRLWVRLGWVLCPAVVLLPFVCLSLCSFFIQPRPGPLVGQDRWLAVIPSLAIAGVSTLLLVLLIWWGRWTARRFGLVCPSCRAPLTGKYRWSALGAGACGRCRAHIMDDVPACFAGVALPTRDEFQGRLGEYRAAYRREGGRYILAILLCFLPGVLAALLFSACEDPFLRPAGLMWLAVLVYFIVLLAPFLVVGRLLGRWESRLRRSHGLACPWCEGSLVAANGKRAGATGRCDRCGQPVWADAA